MIDSTQHKSQLRDYFDGVGFERWSAIYGQAEVSRIRQTVREGHTTMLKQVETWLDAYALPRGAHVLDAGCGTGLLSVALAQRGFRVTSVDIAPHMVDATRARAEQASVLDQMEFLVGDLEAVSGEFDAIVCLDVLVHYPQPLFEQIATSLAQRTRGPLLITYAPYNRLLAAMHWMARFFPKGQRRTDIQMIPDTFVRQTLECGNMQIQHEVHISQGFYHVALLDAVKTVS
ncbi:MAG: magnesium protoporphyrin IX methyltransferase [Chloroflexi bacterium AL-W]|nr:magnesium protoporphyrin IX methyltransferase [Chloroflexi bacterium AL-N1]NOK65158.1 magnesium protoporphyrin IX methyltransferase [Chloroflexi bacterium AL-N10]NOK72576.1 magnesium protoporphyrin IX methyltransferase [Chloroflexi bacterium AL-N5]NOK79337.1 magnesium protoporphyrin IX methyltransferase [Chloroflexi bacterium AL-W]NOK87253.1 magnesium protoporphyrin IX methyltransferase [Chloroflexi bacterium AL-N15]